MVNFLVLFCDYIQLIVTNFPLAFGFNNVFRGSVNEQLCERCLVFCIATMSLFVSFWVSVYLYFWLLVYLCVYLHVLPSTYASISILVCLSVCSSVNIYVCLSVSPCVRFVIRESLSSKASTCSIERCLYRHNQEVFVPAFYIFCSLNSPSWNAEPQQPSLWPQAGDWPSCHQPPSSSSS